MKLAILFYFLIIMIKAQIIIVPFKTKNPNNLSHDNFMSELENNKIYIELKIGTPYQKIPVFLKLGQIPFFITSSIYNKDIIKFNSTKSCSYIQNDKEYTSFNNYDYTHAFLGEDIISIANISNKDSFLNRTKFFLATNLSEKSDDISGEIGLNILYYYNLPFLNHLKNNHLIKDFIFSIKYTSEDEGELHLGNYYHLYDNNKYYKEIDFRTIHIEIPPVSLIRWEFEFDHIFLGTGNATFLNRALLSYEYGFIYGSYHYFNLIKTIYFDQHQNECEIKHLGNKDIYYVCDTTIDLEKFPELIFVKEDFNFTFKKELWKKFDNKYYFLVVFLEDKSYGWILGKIFFQKYTIFFNEDAELIGFYTKMNEINRIEENSKKKFKLELPWILLILLFILLVLAMIYIIYFLKVKKRKERANELDDYYEYESNKNNNNEKMPIEKN